MASNSDSISIKELASKLKVTDALLKKIIRDFDIETLRNQKRIHLSEEAERTIREILALRASGKKNQEIKELFDASKAEQATTTTKPKQKEKEVAIDTSKTEIEATEDNLETEEVTEETQSTEETKPRFDKRDKFNKKNRFKDRREKFKQQKQESAKTNDEQSQNSAAVVEDEDTIDLASYLDESEDAETTMSMHLSEEGGSDSDLEDLDDEDFADDEDDEFDAEAVEGIDKKISPRKVRRRQFSFRYIQRQIANDSKRIHYIKQKLKRGRLSTKEKMNLEESLEQRSKLLSGWVHLLRWVKS